MRLGLFAYPWDLLDEGPEAAVEAMAERVGCNAIALNANYHHACLLRPRAAGPRWRPIWSGRPGWPRGAPSRRA